MQRMTGQRGSALLLLMGITAALAILTATTVMMLANQQGATANERQQKTSLYYADAALNGAVKRSENKMISQTTTDPWVTQDEMLANITAAFGGSLPVGVTATCITYDNLTPVNRSVKYDSNNDGMMWVEVTVTYQGKTTRMRVLVVQTTKSVVARFPKAALFSDGNINLNGGSGDIYAVNDDGTPYIPSPPGNYMTTIMAGGNFSGNSSTDLAAPGSTTQSVGIKVNGSVSPSGKYGGVTKGGVPALSDYFNQADQANLMFEAKSGTPTQANASATVYTTKAALLGACSYNAATKTYTASTDLVWKPPNNQSGNSTLTLNDAGTTYNFKSLYIMPYDSTHAANLSLGGTTHTNTTALYVGGNFTVNGPTGLQQFGPTYVVGTATWTGPSSGTPLRVQTTNYMDAS
jgi:Tfp pilus assembly protein PilX